MEFAHIFGKNTDMLTFELLNEVTKKEYSDKWNEISENCIKNIREIAPDINIIIGGYYNNSLEAIKDLKDPYDDKIVYTFHAYEPLLFTHQGAYWIETMDTEFRCDYTMPYSKYEELSQKYLCQAYASFKKFDQNECPNENYFEVLLEEAIRVAKQRNVALYCGEYGVIDKADKKEAAKWFHDFHAVMDKYNIGRCVWNYKEMDFEISPDFRELFVAVIGVTTVIHAFYFKPVGPVLILNIVISDAGSFRSGIDDLSVPDIYSDMSRIIHSESRNIRYCLNRSA